MVHFFLSAINSESFVRWLATNPLVAIGIRPVLIAIANASVSAHGPFHILFLPPLPFNSPTVAIRSWKGSGVSSYAQCFVTCDSSHISSCALLFFSSFLLFFSCFFPYIRVSRVDRVGRCFRSEIRMQGRQKCLPKESKARSPPPLITGAGRPANDISGGIPYLHAAICSLASG